MGEEFRITLKNPDEVEPNDEFLALLRDGERKTGEPRGVLDWRLGHLFQEFMAHQARVADDRKSAVKGKIVLTFSFQTGPDGSQGYTCDEKVTRAKMPVRPSMVLTDLDGCITSRTAEPLVDRMYEKKREAATEASNKTSKV